MPKSTATNRSESKKPNKPYDGFPLFPHANKQWCKKIRGKLWYFGTWDDPDAALQTYLDQRDDIQAGRDPKRQRSIITAETITVAEVVNLYLESLDTRRKRREVGDRHFSDCLQTCRRIVGHFGRNVAAASLRAADFAALRKSFPKTWGPTRIGTETQRVRCAFHWAAESEVIPAVPNFGPEFKKPPKRVKRMAKANRESQHGKLDYQADEIRRLLAVANGWLKACILLGVNMGFGNEDCSKLRSNHIDFDSGWYDLPRHKTGIERRAMLWPETRQAIRQAMNERPAPKDDRDRDLCFLTERGWPLQTEQRADDGTVTVSRKLTYAFGRVLRECDLYRPGRNFYSLRRTFETVAGASKDQPAVDLVMGHDDPSMAAVYRQGIDDDRLIAVAEHVRTWLFNLPGSDSGKA